MSRRRRATWWAFGAAVAIGTGVLAWLSVAMLRLERSEAEAGARLEHEAAMSEVLWRMDAWLAPLLTAEAQRPLADYRAFNPVANAYTNLLSRLTPGDVLAPSPLLTFRSDLFPLHFQVDAKGTISSPQVPEGNELDVLQGQTLANDVAGKGAILRAVSLALTPKQLEKCSVAAETQFPVLSAQPTPLPAQVEAEEERNYQQRAQGTKGARQKLAWASEEGGDSGKPANADVAPGPLLPMWIDGTKDQHLVFVRRVPLGDGVGFQGVLAAWPHLRDALLAEVRDAPVTAGARLVRVGTDHAWPRSRLLTTVPAALETPDPRVVLPTFTPIRGLLVLAWLAFAGVAVLVGFTLRAALAFGDRRARFASAVTHELRTPLTTFRMYSEMLAQGMVRDEDRRRQYLETLQSEADRLSRLVENVLAYARIEDGRFTAQRVRMTLDDLVERTEPVLARRAQDAGVEFSVELHDADATLLVDADAVGQILFNLVDNACKYGAGPILLHGARTVRHIELAVHDCGAGIPVAHRQRIFAAFDRGERSPGDNEKPGVGLGLALARSLARDLGGDLTLADAASGTRFVLRLPATT